MTGNSFCITLHLQLVNITNVLSLAMPFFESLERQTSLCINKKRCLASNAHVAACHSSIPPRAPHRQYFLLERLPPSHL